MSLKILHLSDLHIGKSYFEEDEFAANIRLALKDENLLERGVNQIVVTGDIFDASALNGKEYKALIKKAVNFFEVLRKELNKKSNKKLSKEDFLFVPGNHEQDRGESEKGKYAFEKYEEFIRDFYKGIPIHYNKEHWSVFKKFEKEKILLLGFNSAKYSLINMDGDEKFIDHGEIRTTQLIDMSDKIDEIPDKEEYFTVTFFHHHFYSIEEKGKNIDVSMLGKRDRLLKHLSKYNLGVVLHGHKHTSTNRRINTSSSMGEADNIINVIGCGSSNKSDTSINNFNYIEVFGLEDSLDLRLKEFEFTGAGFSGRKWLEIPIDSGSKANVKIMEQFKKMGKEERKYQDLKNTDTDTPAEALILTLENTLGKLIGTSELIDRDNRIIIYVLLTAHYRYAINCGGKYLRLLDDYKKNIISKDFDSKEKEDLLHELLNVSNINEASKFYEKLKEVSNDKEKKYLRFLMISFFLSELHIVLRDKADKFYEEVIKCKSNIEVNEVSIINEIQGGEIEFEIDEDRRAVGISVNCTTANAHKIVTLIIKEFELLLNKYDEDFMKVGFKVYYIVSKIKKLIHNGKVELESHNFEAYIPTLIPLLAGENLYASKNAFARELIQNSIDAINIRKIQDSDWDKKGLIEIELGEESGRKYFKISDNGLGMNKYVLERYFTSIGRSFYKSKDFDDLNCEYNPISMFGIGFLSCFIIGKKVEVKTKYYKKKDFENQCHKLEIPNFDGCFFIEGSDKKNIGTEIKVYENQDRNIFEEGEIFHYIIKNVKNIPVDLKILKSKGVEKKIEKYQMIENIVRRTKKYRLLFIENLDVRKTNNQIDMDRYYKSKKYRQQFENCLWVYKEDKHLDKKDEYTVNNAGIRLNYGNKLNSGFENFISYVNFSSDMIEIDVSRDYYKESKIKLSDYYERIRIQMNKFNIDKAFSTKIPYYIAKQINKENFAINKIKLIVNDEKIVFKYDAGKEKTDYNNVLEYYKEVFSLNEKRKYLKQRTKDMCKNLLNDPMMPRRRKKISINESFVPKKKNDFDYDVKINISQIRNHCFNDGKIAELEIESDSVFKSAFMYRLKSQSIILIIDKYIELYENILVRYLYQDQYYESAFSKFIELDNSKFICVNDNKIIEPPKSELIKNDSLCENFLLILYIGMVEDIIRTKRRTKHYFTDIELILAEIAFKSYLMDKFTLEELKNGIELDLKSYINDNIKNEQK